MTIGERISALIEDNNIKIKDLAEQMKVNPRQITRWENDEAEMGIYKLKKLCEMSGVSADYILGLPKDLKWER